MAAMKIFTFATLLSIIVVVAGDSISGIQSINAGNNSSNGSINAGNPDEIIDAGNPKCESFRYGCEAPGFRNGQCEDGKCNRARPAPGQETVGKGREELSCEKDICVGSPRWPGDKCENDTDCGPLMECLNPVDFELETKSEKRCYCKLTSGDNSTSIIVLLYAEKKCVNMSESGKPTRKNWCSKASKKSETRSFRVWSSFFALCGFFWAWNGGLY